MFTWNPTYYKEEKRANDEAKRANHEAKRANHEAKRANDEAERAERETQRAERETQRAEREAQRAEREAQRAVTAEIKDAELQREIDGIKLEIKLNEKEEKRLLEQFNWGQRRHPMSSEEVSRECERKRKAFQDESITSERHTFLLFGPTSHGKSSLGNGFIAALEDKEHPPSYHHVANSEESLTKEMKIKQFKRHRIIDMPGIFEAKTIKDENIRKIVLGQIPWVSKITTTLETPDDQKALNDPVECVIIVLRYDMTDLSPELKRQIGVILSLCQENLLSCHLVLTHLDICDSQFKDTGNLPYIYKSAKVLKAVENMSKETGIPPYNISFVKNYTFETETDVNSKLQYLRILGIVKESADLVVEARRTKASMTEYYRTQN